MFDVLTLGESMVVLYPPEPSKIEENNNLLFDIGGAESNVAIALSRLGFKVNYVTKLGNDPFGKFINKTLKKEKVFIESILTDSEYPTGVFFREYLEDGARRVYYYRKNSAASNLSIKDFDFNLVEQCKMVHLTGLTPALSESCAKLVDSIIDKANSLKIPVSFDPNYRKQLWSGEKARSILEPMIRKSNLLFIGHEDAEAIFGSKTSEKMFEFLKSLGPDLIVFKEGEYGARVWEKNGKIYQMPALKVDNVIDPVGAGDGFVAGYISGWLEGKNSEECLKRGNYIGAKSVQVIGDYAGYPLEIV